MTTKTYEKIKQILVERFAINPSQIQPEADFHADLGFDSMDVIDLLLSVNEVFSMRIPERALEKVHTIAQLVAAVENNKVKI